MESDPAVSPAGLSSQDTQGARGLTTSAVIVPASGLLRHYVAIRPEADTTLHWPDATQPRLTIKRYQPPRASVRAAYSTPVDAPALAGLAGWSGHPSLLWQWLADDFCDGGDGAVGCAAVLMDDAFGGISQCIGGRYVG